MIGRIPLPCRAGRALVAAAALAWVSGVAASSVKTAHVEAELVAEKTALVPGEPMTVALRLSMEKGWHTYWRNPGDSGLPTTLEWKLLEGIDAGPIAWPAPRALAAGPLVNYGYEGEALHLVELTPKRAVATGGTLVLEARADWLVCKELCIPEGADLKLALPVATASSADPRWGAPIAAARAALPRPLAGWQVAATGRGRTVEVKLVPLTPTDDPGALRFFPYAESRIEPSAPQTLRRDGDAYVLTLPVSFNLTGDFGRVAGVVTAGNGFAGGVRASTVRSEEHTSELQSLS